ncbi:MAG: SurA N-terminal domain-containing protein [Symbiobacteriia bacterium]
MTRRVYLVVVVAALLAAAMGQPARAGINHVRTAVQSSVEYGTPQERQATLDAAAALKAAKLDDHTVLFRVNGEAVTAGQYNRMKAALGVQARYQGKPAPTDADVGARLIKLAVLYVKARAAGVYPTDAEITEYVAQTRSQMTSVENYDQFQQFVSGLGMTEDEYWAAPWVREEQTNSLVAARVRDLVTTSVTANPGETPDQLTRRRAETFRTWWDQQVAQAKTGG